MNGYNLFVGEPIPDEHVGKFVLNHNLTTKRCKKKLALMLDTENRSISWLQHRSVIANKLGVKKK